MPNAQFDSKLRTMILETAQRLKIDIELMDETGRILVCANEGKIGEVDKGLDSLTLVDGEGETEYNRSYFFIESENYKPMFLMIPGKLEQTRNYGFLICELIKEILQTSLKRPGREEIFRDVMLDHYDPHRLQEAIQDFDIDPTGRNCVILVQTFESDALGLYDAMIKIFPRSNKDVVTLINRYVIALVRQMDNEDDIEGIMQLVNALDDTISNELSVGAYIGVGGIKRGLVNIKDSFFEAQEAINLGVTQQNKGHVFTFQRLLLERLLHEIPRELRRKYYDFAYTDTMQKLMTDEILETMTKFFENNLNLSEAARQLYIHRNTLIYRLEKIQKATGLDLRNFDDAVLFKIIIMLGKSLSSNNRID